MTSGWALFNRRMIAQGKEAGLTKAQLAQIDALPGSPAVEVATHTPRLLDELLTAANAGEEARGAAELKDQQIDNAIAAANREFKRAEAAEAELAQLRAAQPPPEPADAQALRAEVSRLEKLVQHWQSRTESAEHEARVWASGKTGDVATIHSYALRSQGRALDAALRRERETLRKLRAAEGDVGRWRDRALSAEAHVDKYLRAIEPTVDRALAAHERRAEAEAEAERLRAMLDDIREELDAAKRAAAPDEDPGVPLEVVDLGASERDGYSWRSLYIQEGGRAVFDARLYNATEEEMLREWIRCYNLIHFEADGTPEGESFDRALKAASEKLLREDSLRAAASIFPEVEDELKRRIAASLIFNVMSGRDRKPPATVDEAVDRAMAPLRESIEAAKIGLAVVQDGIAARASWDRTMAQTIDAQVGGQAQSLPVEGEVGGTCGAVSPADEMGISYVCDEAPYPAHKVHSAPRDGKVRLAWFDDDASASFVADGPGGNDSAEPPIATVTFTRRSEQGTGERILEVREGADEDMKSRAEFLARLPLLVDEQAAQDAIALEENRLRRESLVIPSFSVGALWMWKLLTGRGERS